MRDLTDRQTKRSYPLISSSGYYRSRLVKSSNKKICLLSSFHHHLSHCLDLVNPPSLRLYLYWAYRPSNETLERIFNSFVVSDLSLYPSTNIFLTFLFLLYFIEDYEKLTCLYYRLDRQRFLLFCFQEKIDLGKCFFRLWNLEKNKSWFFTFLILHPDSYFEVLESSFLQWEREDLFFDTRLVHQVPTPRLATVFTIFSDHFLFEKLIDTLKPNQRKRLIFYHRHIKWSKVSEEERRSILKKIQGWGLNYVYPIWRTLTAVPELSSYYQLDPYLDLLALVIGFSDGYLTFNYRGGKEERRIRRWWLIMKNLPLMIQEKMILSLLYLPHDQFSDTLNLIPRLSRLLHCFRE